MSKRLTERDEFGNANIIGVDSADLQLNLGFDEFNRVTNALNTLAHFEENEEDYNAIKSACAAVDDENERLRSENRALHEFCKFKANESEPRTAIRNVMGKAPAPTYKIPVPPRCEKNKEEL